MSFSKTLLRATTLIAALGGSMAVAHAAPQLYVASVDETAGTYFNLPVTTSTTGALTTSATDAAGSMVSIAAQGLPLNTGLATTTLDASTTGARSLALVVTQTGLIATSSTMPFTLSFTVNGLLAGSVGSLTFADYISPTNAIYDTSTADLIKQATLTAMSTTNELNTVGVATGLTVGSTYSESEFIRLTFAAAGSLSGSSQLVPNATPVPEPASMALLGVGLFGLGMVSRRGRHQG